MSSTASQWLSSGNWRTELTAAGFTRTGDRRSYVREGVTMDIEEDWLVLWVPDGEEPACRPAGQQGPPGLWKRVVEQGKPREVFEIPPSLFFGPDRADETDEGPSPLRSVLDWAMATRGGGSPDGWTAPPEAELADLIPNSALTVQHGAYSCQGWLEHESDRLALHIPIVSEVPPDLSPERSSWLRCLLAAAQNKWRLVRLRLSQDSRGLMVSAEVDLTGVPLSVLEPMVSIALPALRNVAEWVVCSTVFLTLSRNGCRALKPGTACPDSES